MAESRKISVSLCFPLLPVIQRGSQETVEQSQAATGDHGSLLLGTKPIKWKGLTWGKGESLQES